MSFLLAAWALAAAASAAVAAEAPSVAPELGKITDRCSAPGPTPQVWIFKQWHAGPAIDTRSGGHGPPLPQEPNQTAIYRQLERWVAARQLNEVIAEGCAGEIDAHSPLRMNGWDLPALREAAAKPGYAEIVTSVPLKLEAKFGDQLRTRCGDDEALLKENSLAFSDLRGTAGFLARIEENRHDPARLKPYLEGALQLYKLPAGTPVEQVTRRLKQDLKASLARARELIARRNVKLLERIRASLAAPGGTPLAVVFGGSHARDLVQKLDAAQISCAVVEPAGYRNDEAALLDRLNELLK